MELQGACGRVCDRHILSSLLTVISHQPSRISVGDVFEVTGDEMLKINTAVEEVTRDDLLQIKAGIVNNKHARDSTPPPFGKRAKYVKIRCAGPADTHLLQVGNR